MTILYITDFLLMPFFVLILYFIFKRVRDKRYKGSIIAKYFMPALMFRLLGAFLSALMYQYYYKYGDTFYYFYGCTDIFNMFLSDPATALEMCFSKYENFSPDALRALKIHRLFREPSTALVMQLGGFFSPFALGSYIGISFFMTTFAFLGSWLMYRVFYDMYPKLHKSIAYAVLFVPSICFWGTGLMKESLTMGGLGFMLYGCYYLFIKRQRFLSASIFLFAGAYLLAFVKVYVILALAPAMVVWVFLMYREKIRIAWLRTVSLPLFLMIGAVGGIFVLQRIGAAFSQYSFENIMSQAAKTQWWLTVSTERDGGSGYSLGTLDPSIGGLIRVFPKAVNVTLFRPYIWETRKPIVLISAIESFFTLCFTLYVFFKVGLWRTTKAIFSDPVVLFCLIFAVIFAFAIGFSTLNFGSLARYKTPCLPFFFVALIVLYDKRSVPKKSNAPTLAKTAHALA
jgi:hypothetical protein